MKKKSIPEDMASNKRPLDGRVKIAMAVGIALVAVGVGYLGYFGWYHSQTDTARNVSYDEFPEELRNETSVDGDFIESTSSEYSQDEIPSTNVTFGDVPGYVVEDPANDITVTGVYQGTDYASIIGVNSNAVVVAYDTVIGKEEGWTSEPVVFTATMGDGSYRMLTYVNVDGTWVDPSIGLVTLEYGQTYKCVAYCEAPNYDEEIHIFSYASDSYCQELVVTR